MSPPRMLVGAAAIGGCTVTDAQRLLLTGRLVTAGPDRALLIPVEITQHANISETGATQNAPNPSSIVPPKRFVLSTTGGF